MQIDSTRNTYVFQHETEELIQQTSWFNHSTIRSYWQTNWSSRMGIQLARSVAKESEFKTQLVWVRVDVNVLR
jgi:hypothetical protein